MRIVVIAGAFAPNRFGSSAVVAEQTAVELQARSHEVFVLTAAGADGPGVEVSRWEASGVPVVGLTVPAGGADDEVETQAARVLDVLRPDLVHAHSPRFLGHGPLRAAHRKRIPTVVSVHAGSDWPVDLLAEAHAVVVPTDLRQRALWDAGLEPDRVQLVHNGVAAPDPLWIRQDHHGPLRLGFLGGRSPDEGYQVLLNALNALKRTDYQLTVVDRATARGVRALKERDFRVPGLVRLIARFPPVRDRFFGGIDILVSLAQDPDSACLSVREGLLRGVWPIASDIEGAAQVVVPGRNGLLVRRDSAAEVGSAIAWALDHRAQIEAAREPARLGDGIPLVGDQVTRLESLYSRLTMQG